MSKLASWIAKHMRVRSRDLNKLAEREHDDSRKPRPAAEVVFKWEF